jgi:hypothetical protein
LVKLEVRLTSPIAAPALPDSSLEVNVVYTGLPFTPETLRAASKLASGLGARVTVHVTHVIPYPLALKCPPVPVEFAEDALLQMARGLAVETDIRVYLCRDRTETIRHALRPDSVVVIGNRRRWWPTREQKLAELLKRDGHRVILIGIGRPFR